VCVLLIPLPIPKTNNMIYLKLDKEPSSFIEVLDVLYNKAHPTTLCPTYIDKECTNIECDADKMRSFQALFEIARTYFPTITMSDFYESLYKKQLSFWVCEDIEKVVFHFKGGYNSIPTLGSFLEILNDEYDYDELYVIKRLEEFVEENS
jgi:hypothetical protein